MATLIFPAEMPLAIAYFEECQRAGKKVVGASSFRHRAIRDQYVNWVELPHVTDDAFATALEIAVANFGIDEIFTVSGVVSGRLHALLPAILPAVKLIERAPHDAAWSDYRRAHDVAQKLWPRIDFEPFGSGAKARISNAEFRSMLYHADRLPGMCSHEKLLALSEIARDLPNGDVVEIGTWWGKSAFALLFLARRFAVGHLLCVDPWSAKDLVQGENHIDRFSAALDPDGAFELFVANLRPYAAADVNFLRMRSVNAAERYAAISEVHSEEFGHTTYVGKIALLHIDGNHAESSVQDDISAWSKYLRDGAWIVFDDYRWAYGNGPKLVADRYMETMGERVLRAFSDGNALYVKVSSEE